MAKPLLLLDVDGVLCPFGCDGDPEGYRFVDGDPWLWYSEENGRRLKALQASYEIVWASMWEEAANARVGPLHGLEPLQHVPMLGSTYEDYFRGVTPKLESVKKYINGDRPFAWIDDEIMPDSFDWAATLSAPRLIIRTEAHIGITPEVFDQLEDFAKLGETHGPD